MTTQRQLRDAIEAAVPHGRTDNGGKRDKGAWHDIPPRVNVLWQEHLAKDYATLCAKYPKLGRGNDLNHLGTLGTGNHFIEVCLDENSGVWFLLHSGSRGVGNRLGEFFIALAREDCKKAGISLPDRDLAYFSEGSEHFDDYVLAVTWAQTYARLNRQIMLENIITAVGNVSGIPAFSCDTAVINCHHNYVEKEAHFGEKCWVTRKGAVRAGQGEMGIIPGSMGERSFIVRGKGQAESFCSCSHGAGRLMSRSKAFKTFTVEDHTAATAGVECRKDKDVLDETPKAYKDLDAVMAAQSDLVEIVQTLKQVVCVKG